MCSSYHIDRYINLVVWEPSNFYEAEETFLAPVLHGLLMSLSVDH